MKLIINAIVIFKDFLVYMASTGLLVGLYLRPSVSGHTAPEDEPLLPWNQVAGFKVLYTVRFLIAKVGQHFRSAFRLVPPVRRVQQGLERRALRHLEANGHPVEKDGEIPCVDASRIDPKDFFERYIVRPYPVVLKGFANDTAAVKKWTPEYIGEVCGELMALTLNTEEKDGQGSGELDYMGFGRESVQDVVDSIVTEGAGRNKSIINMKNIFLEHPELLAEAEVNKVSRFAGSLKFAVADFMMAGGETYTPYHCANGFNFFIMVHGKKRWDLIHPNHTYLLYPLYRARFVEGMSQVGHHRYHEDDEDERPLWKYCPRASVLLEPGDMLVLPPWWWHAVDNESESTIAVATRWGFDTYPTRTNALFDLFHWLFPIMWGLKIMSKTRDPRLMALNEDGEDESILFDSWSNRLNDDGEENVQSVDEGGNHFEVMYT